MAIFKAPDWRKNGEEDRKNSPESVIRLELFDECHDPEDEDSDTADDEENGANNCHVSLDRLLQFYFGFRALLSAMMQDAEPIP